MATAGNRWFLGIDIGLTFTKAAVISDEGKIVASAEERHAKMANGVYREHDPDAIWLGETQRIASEVLQSCGVTDLTGICICGPWPSLVVLGQDESCLTLGILLDDGRFDTEVEVLRDMLPRPVIGYELLPRLLWLLRNTGLALPAVKIILSSENFVIYRLTGQALLMCRRLRLTVVTTM